MAFGMKTKENLKKLDVAFAKNSVAPGNDTVIRRGKRSWVVRWDAPSNISAELCYNFTYLAKNGRGRGDPWSLRQSGIYQQVDLKSNKSFWILLHPSASIKDQLHHFNGAFPIDRQNFGGHLLKGHTAFLSEATQGWDEYIENTRTQLDAIVSGVGTPSPEQSWQDIGWKGSILKRRPQELWWLRCLFRRLPTFGIASAATHASRECPKGFPRGHR